MADSADVRSNIRAYAKEQFIPDFVSRQYDRSPILGYLVGQTGSRGQLRPPAYGLINGKKAGRDSGVLVGGSGVSAARRATISGSERVHVAAVQTGTSTSVKNLSARDTVATLTNPTTASQDQNRKTGFVKWSRKQVEVMIWKVTLRTSRGSYAIGSATADAFNQGLQEMFDDLIDEIWTGSPTDQDAEGYWDSQQGINDVCHTTNTLYGIDRTSVTYYDSFRVTGAKTANLALIDDANITQGIQDISDGVGLVLHTKANYLTVKAEALAKNGTLLHTGDYGDDAKTGIKNECVKYGNVLITYDPGLKDWSAVTSGDPDLSSGCFMGDMSKWMFQTNSGMNFNVGELVDLGKYSEGGKDAYRSLVDLEYRFWTDEPWGNILYTNVS